MINFRIRITSIYVIWKHNEFFSPILVGYYDVSNALYLIFRQLNINYCIIFVSHNLKKENNFILNIILRLLCIVFIDLIYFVRIKWYKRILLFNILVLIIYKNIDYNIS